MLEEVQNVHENLRYALSVEWPSAANGYTAQEVGFPCRWLECTEWLPPVATAERAMAEQAQFKKKQFEEEAQPSRSPGYPEHAVRSQAVAASPVEQFDHVRPRTTRAATTACRATPFLTRVHDTTEERTNNTANP